MYDLGTHVGASLKIPSPASKAFRVKEFTDVAVFILFSVSVSFRGSLHQETGPSK
jgi:hypothetical protein